MSHGRRGSSQSSPRRRRRTRRLIVFLLALFLIAISGLLILFVTTDTFNNTMSSIQIPSTVSAATVTNQKPIILYINQGNGRVNETNFGQMLNFALSKGFNTVFFQVYYKGDFLFMPDDLSYFVSSAHSKGLKLFFALSFTNDSQTIPSSIYTHGEDGISLDMSTLDLQGQTSLYDALESNYHAGITAITTFDFSTSLRPQWLIFETYGSQYDNSQFVHKGIIGSVGVFASASSLDYHDQFNYVLANSDGVMVFDYYGLFKSGY
jgi:hypothetical protein